MEKSEYKSLFAELEQYESFGVNMKLEGCPASPMQIVSAHMVKEDQVYMRDYVWDERGNIKELTFHRINRKS